MEQYMKSKGFTLIEAMIAGVVLSFGFLAVNKLQTSLIKSKSDASQRSEASTMATAKMEQIRDFNSIQAYNTISSGSDTTNGKNASYTRNWVVTNSSNQKGINLTLTWLTSSNQSKTVQLTSALAKTDPVLSGDTLALSSKLAPLPTPTQGTPVNSNIPAGATNNGDGTSNYIPPNSNVTLKYDNTSGNVIAINNGNVISISGSITLATGPNSPGTIDLSLVTVNPSNNANAYCFYSGSTGNYTCYVMVAWQGTITLGGISNVKVCTNTTQPYSNLIANIVSQNFALFKVSKSCSGGTPIQHQVL